MSSSGGRILVIRGGAIGDFILTLPALAALRGQFPGAHLEVLGYPHIVQLAIAGGLVDRVQSIEAGALAGFFARGGELAPGLAAYFSGFDIIISYLYDPDLIFQINVARCSRAQFISGPHRPDERLNLHASKVFLKPLERLAIFEPDSVPRLSLAAPGGTRDELALHPGSGSEEKNWDEKNWSELIARLLQLTPSGLLLVGGEAEGERLQRLAAALPPRRVKVAQSLPLPALGLLLSRCRLYIGHDSGISHLAAAVGLPGVLLWANTNPEIWAPPGGRMTLLRRSDGLASVRVEDVLEAIEAREKCYR